MNKKIPFLTYLFFVLIYANQGLSGLPGQALYYLKRESWRLTATQLGWITFAITIPWTIKPLYGFITDCLPIKNYRTKYHLIISYILLLLCIVYILFFGFNLISMIIVGFIMSFCTGFNDVANDTQMVVLEQKNNLNGRIQAIQWTSLGVAGLAVSLGGAYIASTFPEPFNYKLAYAITAILPLTTLFYLTKFYKEKKSFKKIDYKNIFINIKKSINKPFLLGLAFIACLQFSPSFGNALMITIREQMGVEKMFLGYTGAIGTVIGLVGYLLYYWKAYKFPLKKLLYFAIIFGAITNLFYLYLPNKYILIIYNLLFGAFGGISFLAIMSFMAKIIPKGAEGLLYALATSVNNFAGGLSEPVGGFIYDKLGYNFNVIIATGFTLLCLFFIPKLDISNER
jgi:MFS family permease